MDNVPFCDRCKKPVESIVNTEAMRGLGMRLLVFCHGEREEVVLTAAEVMGIASNGRLVPGVAFKQAPELPPASPAESAR